MEEEKKKSRHFAPWHSQQGREGPWWAVSLPPCSQPRLIYPHSWRLLPASFSHAQDSLEGVLVGEFLGIGHPCGLITCSPVCHFFSAVICS